MKKSQLLCGIRRKNDKETLVWLCCCGVLGCCFCTADIFKADGALTVLLFVKVNSEPGCTHFCCKAQILQQVVGASRGITDHI